MAVYFDHRKPWYTDIISSVGSTLAGELVKGMMQRDSNYRDDRAWRKQWGAAQDQMGGAQGGPSSGPVHTLSIEGSPEAKTLSDMTGARGMATPWGGRNGGINLDALPEEYRPAEGDGLTATVAKAFRAARGPTRAQAMGAMGGLSPRFQERGLKLLDMGYGNEFKLQDGDALIQRIGPTPNIRDQQGMFDYMQKQGAYGQQPMAATNAGFANNLYNIDSREREGAAGRDFQQQENRYNWAQKKAMAMQEQRNKEGLLDREIRGGKYSRGSASTEKNTEEAFQKAMKELEPLAAQAQLNDVAREAFETRVKLLYPQIADRLIEALTGLPDIFNKEGYPGKNKYFSGGEPIPQPEPSQGKKKSWIESLFSSQDPYENQDMSLGGDLKGSPVYRPEQGLPKTVSSRYRYTPDEVAEFAKSRGITEQEVINYLMTH